MAASSAVAAGGSPAERLRARLKQDGLVVVPGCGDPLSAKIAHSVGFEVIFISGFYASASMLGLPDADMLGFADMSALVQRVANAVPEAMIIVDGDVGYGAPPQVKRTIAGFGAAGAACVMIEDQEAPKQCGHTEGKRVVSFADACTRIQAAVDARNELGPSGPLVMARTDARVISEEEAIRRGKAFRDIGADIVFMEAPLTKESMKADLAAVPGVYHMANMVEWAKTPQVGHQALNELGYKIGLHSVLMLNASIGAMHRWARQLRDGTGKHDTEQKAVAPDEEGGAVPPLMDFKDMQRMVGFPGYFADMKRYREVHAEFSSGKVEPALKKARAE